MRRRENLISLLSLNQSGFGSETTGRWGSNSSRENRMDLYHLISSAPHSSCTTHYFYVNNRLNNYHKGTENTDKSFKLPFLRTYLFFFFKDQWHFKFVQDILSSATWLFPGLGWGHRKDSGAKRRYYLGWKGPHSFFYFQNLRFDTFGHDQTTRSSFLQYEHFSLFSDIS